VSERCAVGIDLGGTKIFGALVDEHGRMVATGKADTLALEGPDAVLGRMFSITRSLLGRAGGRRVLGIGLGIPGLMDREAGISLHSPNLKWQSVPVKEPFRRECGLPVEMDNDVRVHAVGELLFGAGRGYRNFILITLGTGIGSGVVLDRQVFRGPTGMAGEFGHQTVIRDGPRCGCGNYGCIEALASGPGIARRAREAVASYQGESPLRQMPPGALTAAAVARAAREGDPLARRIYDEVGEDLGIVLANYFNLMGPEVAIIGGGVASAGEILFEPVRRTVLERVMIPIKPLVRIVPAELGEEAGAVGAAAMIPGLAEA
jgi:glucokinase